MNFVLFALISVTVLKDIDSAKFAGITFGIGPIATPFAGSLSFSETQFRKKISFAQLARTITGLLSGKGKFDQSQKQCAARSNALVRNIYC